MVFLIVAVLSIMHGAPVLANQCDRQLRLERLKTEDSQWSQEHDAILDVQRSNLPFFSLDPRPSHRVSGE